MYSNKKDATSIPLAKFCIFGNMTFIKVSLFSIIGLLSTISFGQKNKILLKTNPLTNIYLYNGSGFNVGMEANVNNVLALNTEATIYYPFDKWNTLFIDHKGFFIQEEFKFYFHKIEAKKRSYLSLLANYSKSKYKQYLCTEGSNCQGSLYPTKREFLGLELNFGVIKTFENRFIFEYFLGVGARFNTIETTINQNNSAYYGDWTVPSNWIQKNGTNFIPKFNGGFKIGYVLY